VGITFCQNGAGAPLDDTPKKPLGRLQPRSAWSRNSPVQTQCRKGVVWEYQILTFLMAALVKFAASPKVFRRNCKRMLRQQYGQT
jgi:hypothetical protein